MRHSLFDVQPLGICQEKANDTRDSEQALNVESPLPALFGVEHRSKGKAKKYAERAWNWEQCNPHWFLPVGAVGITPDGSIYAEVYLEEAAY